MAPAGRVASLPGAGSVLMPPWQIREFGPEGVEVGVQYSRYHVGGNNAVHGRMVAMMFDVMCGIIIHSIGRPISRTTFLHVDYRNITPIDVPLTMRGWASKVEGRKTFVNAELRDPAGTLLAESNGLMVQLLPGQPLIRHTVGVSQPNSATLHRLTTPRAAALAGVLFAVLFSTALYLIRSSLPEGAQPGSRWLDAGSGKIHLASSSCPSPASASCGSSAWSGARPLRGPVLRHRHPSAAGCSSWR